MPIFQSLKHGIIVAGSTAAVSIAFAGAAAAQNCPQWELGGTPIVLDAQSAADGVNFQLQAGGLDDLRACTDVPGHGHITRAPNFSVSYDNRSLGHDLEIRVDAVCDTTMLINTAGGAWEFSDDENGLDPAIRLSAAPSGRYDVWLGTYGEESCAATLTAQAAAPAPALCPEWSLGGAEVSLSVGQTESRPVMAGGTINMFEAECPGTEAHGYLSHAPNFTLFFDNQDQVSTLDISVTGECDQTLLVNDPSASWVFNDDDTDLHPRIQIGDATGGRYDIWVGAFGSTGCQSSITIAASSPDAAPAASK